MMKYLILKSCVAGGKPRNAGEVVELPEDEGKSLTAIGRVEVAKADHKPETSDRSVSLPGSDAGAMSKRGKKV